MAEQKFNTFKGVFLPSILTILGVIMFLRMGWVVGNLGLPLTILLVTIASSITLLTGLAISALATNMKVAGGGAYYIISRSLGVEAGAAIGIPLYLAQAVGASFYIAGFAEAVHSLIPAVNLEIIGGITLIILSLLALYSADLALKGQMVILVLILSALISFFLGDSPNLTAPAKSPDLAIGFWPIFAVFFPAVTGIEAGLSLSGNLRNPAKSLPLGTISAVICGYIIYLAIPWFLISLVPAEILKQENLIMVEVAKWGPLILLGLWGASLSSALGALLGAPRTLQALARDKVLPKILGRSLWNGEEPHIAIFLTFMIAGVGVIFGNLNILAPILSMFFLTSYGMLNFSTMMEEIIANPSWRPKFRLPWQYSAVGFFGCVSVMFMINAGASIIALSIVFAIYYFMQKRKMRTYWTDIRRSIFVYLAKLSIKGLARLPNDERSWRPNVLVLSGAPAKRWYLIELGDAIASSSGFLTLSTVLINKNNKIESRLPQMQSNMEDFLERMHIHAFVRLSIADDFKNGAISLVRDYGLGPLVPNTIVLGDSGEQNDKFAEIIIKLYELKRNIVIVRLPDSFFQATTTDDRREFQRLKNLNYYFTNNSNRRIDVWWGRERNNARLGLVFGFLLQRSKTWSGAELSLKTICSKKEETSSKNLLNKFMEESRLLASHKVFTEENRQLIFPRIREESKNCGLVFLGVMPPSLEKYRQEPQETVEDYAKYLRNLMHKLSDFPPTALVLSAEELDFNKIFIS